MKKKYYYNPHTKQPRQPMKKKFVIKDYLDYVNSHAWLGRCLKEVSNKYGVRIPTLRAALGAIGQCTHEFASTASQKTLAMRAGLSVRAFNSALHALRKANILTTKHRYKGTGATKRRTTSVTVVGAFLKFLDIVEYQAFKAMSAATMRKHEIAGFIGRVTKIKEFVGDVT
jgi:hypothetical protein